MAVSAQAGSAVAQEIIERYLARTPRSREYSERAKAALAGGETRTSTYYEPYPAFMEHGTGCMLTDIDGNTYVDYVNNYTSLIHGHTHPHILEAAMSQLEKGTVFGAPGSVQVQLAEMLCQRVPSLERVRFCNSGTEATLFAIRAARAFTGRDRIIKMDGGYHGTHDSVGVNMFPDLEAVGLPTPSISGPGIPASVLNDTLVAPFNNLELVETLLKKYKGEIAAIILEPMPGSGGFVPPKPEFLRGLRALADQYDVLLIFDEIITFRLHVGGLQGYFGVQPDLTALGKIIGGGFPVGAFGGRADVMAVFNHDHPRRVTQAGTFNGNDMTMVAGLAAVELYDEAQVARVNALGDRLRAGYNQAFQAAGIQGQVTGFGSLNQLHWRGGEIQNVKDVMLGVRDAGQLPQLAHLEMMNRGVYSAARGLYSISTPMTEAVIDETVAKFAETLEVLRPCIASAAPQLLG